ncbi:uncharacterized protein HMPREF1541_09467 [Cyphellophora europaea CBS 101466]|uniref:Uncharacterized protein n=1 Tax=Cyphellophora europaea (strain CBS 101466) TaxID=1220924 RepID=W2SAH0_CYPE1|nr:uncharacterized protein HMPREF1541_09467 [Cyphellophora europaea CBS 101466]ETN45635.1 hypothetical protein HMPREF1541_09467 [Cyphellophora europaea CBS 101466]
MASLLSRSILSPTSTIQILRIAITTLLYLTLANSHPPASQHPIAATPSSPSHLLVTAVRSTAVAPHHDSYLQCLRASHPFTTYPTVGASSFLGPATNVTMVVLPPRSEEGWHRPPAPMWFVLLRGRALVRTADGDEVRIQGGSGGKKDGSHGERVEGQMVLALDVLGKGHLTFYPGDEESVALQVPLAEGWDLESEVGEGRWEVVREGAC